MSDPRRADRTDSPSELTELTEPHAGASASRSRLRALAIPAAVVAVMGVGGAAAVAVPTMLDQGTKTAAVAQPISQVLPRSESAAPTPTPSDTPTPSATPTPTPTSTPTPAPSTAPAAPKPAAATKAPRPALADVIGSRYADTRLNLRAEPSESAAKVGTLEEGEKVTITEARSGQWRQVKIQNKARWTLAEHLVKKRPAAESSATKGAKSGATSVSSSVSGATCADGSSVERGLTSNAIKVHRAVCAQWPGLSYGGLRAGDSGSEHSTGHALDIMVRGGKGDEIAAYLKANASRLGVSELIWEQRIWTTQRGSEGWRSMSDRGGATANHFDHVHVTVR